MKGCFFRLCRITSSDLRKATTPASRLAMISSSLLPPKRASRDWRKIGGVDLIQIVGNVGDDQWKDAADDGDVAPDIEHACHGAPALAAKQRRTIRKLV